MFGRIPHPFPQRAAGNYDAIVQVIKRKTPTFYIERRIVQGSQQLIDCLRERTQGFLGVSNTAYIERINATFRQRLACLTRRSRCAAHHISTVTHSMFVVGCFYNFYLPHTSLQQQVDNVLVDALLAPLTTSFAVGLPNTLKLGSTRENVLYTISVLKLNQDEDLVTERQTYICAYVNLEITFEYLEKRAPFIAYELERQNLTESIKTSMRRHCHS